jgi:hypothetical protein
MSFPTNPANGQTTTVNGITYIYNQTNNAWKRQTLTDIVTTGNITASYFTLLSGINFSDNSTITSAAVYDLDEIYPDGTINTFVPRYNQSQVTLTSPWNLLVTINGIFQPAFAENSDTVWLSSTLCASRGYTISSGNIKFADSPPAGTVVNARTQPGSSNPTLKIYPFKPVDIVLGM